MHVAIALNYNHKIDYYINGEKIDSQVITEGNGKANYLNIGKSFWNDYYDGNMCQIAIWDRKLSDDEIKRYVAVEQPLDCAGSAKSEGLGISLLTHIRNDDPTALIGLPLIRTCQLLREVGLMTP